MRRVAMGVVVAVLVFVGMGVGATAQTSPGAVHAYPVLEVEPRAGYLIKCLPETEAEGHQPFPLLIPQKPGSAYVVCVTR